MRSERRLTVAGTQDNVCLVVHSRDALLMGTLDAANLAQEADETLFRASPSCRRNGSGPTSGRSAIEFCGRVSTGGRLVTPRLSGAGRRQRRPEFHACQPFAFARWAKWISVMRGGCVALMRVYRPGVVPRLR